jgi:hypothetical protein
LTYFVYYKNESGVEQMVENTECHSDTTKCELALRNIAPNEKYSFSLEVQNDYGTSKRLQNMLVASKADCTNVKFEACRPCKFTFTNDALSKCEIVNSNIPLIKTLTECPAGRTGSTCTGYDILSSVKAATKPSPVNIATGETLGTFDDDKNEDLNISLASNFTDVNGVLVGYTSAGKLCTSMNEAEAMCDSFDDCTGISYVPGECPGYDEWTMRSTSILSFQSNSEGMKSKKINRPTKITHNLVNEEKQETADSVGSSTTTDTTATTVTDKFDIVLVVDAKHGDDKK